MKKLKLVLIAILVIIFPVCCVACGGDPEEEVKPSVPTKFDYTVNLNTDGSFTINFLSDSDNLIKDKYDSYVVYVKYGEGVEIDQRDRALYAGHFINNCLTKVVFNLNGNLYSTEVIKYNGKFYNKKDAVSWENYLKASGTTDPTDPTNPTDPTDPTDSKREVNLAWDTPSVENIAANETIVYSYEATEESFISIRLSSQSQINVSVKTDNAQPVSLYNATEETHSIRLVLPISSYKLAISSNNGDACNIDYIIYKSDIEELSLDTSLSIRFAENQFARAVSFIPSQNGNHSITLSNAKDFSLYTDDFSKLTSLIAATNTIQTLENGKKYYFVLERSDIQGSQNTTIKVAKSTDATNATAETAEAQTLNSSFDVDIDVPSATLYYKLKLTANTLVEIKATVDKQTESKPYVRIYQPDNSAGTSLSTANSTGYNEYAYGADVLNAGDYIISVRSSNSKVGRFNISVSDPRNRATAVSYNQNFTLSSSNSQSEQWFSFTYAAPDKSSDANSFHMYANRTNIGNFYTGAYHGAAKYKFSLYSMESNWYSDSEKTIVDHSIDSIPYDYTENVVGRVYHTVQIINGRYAMTNYSTYYFCVRFSSDMSGSESFFITNNYLNLNTY